MMCARTSDPLLIYTWRSGVIVSVFTAAHHVMKLGEIPTPQTSEAVTQLWGVVTFFFENISPHNMLIIQAEVASLKIEVSHLAQLFKLQMISFHVS